MPFSFFQPKVCSRAGGELFKSDGQLREIERGEQTVHVIKEYDTVDIVLFNILQDRLTKITQIDQNKIVMPGKKRRDGIGKAVLQKQELFSRLIRRKLPDFKAGVVV